MLTLIAESKTMDEGRTEVAEKMYDSHRPAGEDRAARIMKGLEGLTAQELAAETGFSPSLAAKLREMVYEFPNKTTGQTAIESFTGVVFKALDYESLPEGARTLCSRDVRIISSLYGLLRPDDIIKPYRLDFTTKAAPDGSALSSFWKKDVTIGLVRTLMDEGHGELLNLLPADAAKCIDWKVVKRFCKVWKADFAEITEGDRSRTPSAGKLKTMRGKLLRQILCDGIADTEQLKTVRSDDYMCEGTPVYPDHLQFIC